MKSSHPKLEDKNNDQSRSNKLSRKIDPTQDLSFSSLMSEELGDEVYSSLKSEESKSTNSFLNLGNCSLSSSQQSESDALQTPNKGVKEKRQLKCPTIPCKYCGKILTYKFMKTHLQKQHKEIYHSLASNSNPENISSERKNNSEIQSASTLLQEDIACLSPYDALNVGNRFDILATEHESPCDSSVKTENNLNPLCKGKSKFKSVNKSLQLTLKENACFKDNEGKDTMESTLSKNHWCHICFRMYTTKSFLTRHLLNFHKIPISSSNESNLNSGSVGNESLLVNQLNSTFSEHEQDSKSPVPNNYKVNSNEVSDLQPSENYQQYTNESSEMERASFDKISFNDSTTAHSMNELSESYMTISPNLNPEDNPTKAVTVKKSRPRNFKCSMCHREFSYCKNLERHMIKDHPNNSSGENNENDLQKCESTLQVTNQPMKREESSHNTNQLLEQTLQNNEYESASHKNNSYFNLPISTENSINNNYSSSNPSDKVSLSKSDSFFHSSVCSSGDFIFQKNFIENAEQKDGGSYSKQESIETVNLNPSASSLQFPISYPSYSKNIEPNSNEQNDINNTQINFNENVSCKSTFFTEMLTDSIDTSLPYQTSSRSSTMQSLPHAVYQQSSINLEASSVSTESNECPVCFKKMSTQDQLRNHIEKLHPSSVLENTPEDDKQIDSKFNSMFTELQQAYSEINYTESCENVPLKVEENNLDLSNQKEKSQEFSFNSDINRNASTNKDRNQEQRLTEFCNNFGDSSDPSSLHSLQQDEQFSSEISKSIHTSPPNFQTETMKEQIVSINKEGSVMDDSSVAALAGNNLDPIVLTKDSSALKHAWMFSDLLEEFEAQTGPTSVVNKTENEKCEEMKNEVNLQINFQATTTTNSSLIDNYLTELQSVNSTVKEPSSNLDSEINKDVKFSSEKDFLSKGNQSVAMNAIFSDKFLSVQSDFIPHPANLTNEQGEVNDPLFSSNLDYAACGYDDQNNCEVQAENMGQLFESEIAKQISFLLNSGNESPNHDLLNIGAVVSSGNDDFAGESLMNYTADQVILPAESEHPSSEISCTNIPPVAPKIPNSQPQKKFKCEICSKELSASWSLTRHKRKVHSDIFNGSKINQASLAIKRIQKIERKPKLLAPPIIKKTNSKHFYPTFDPSTIKETSSKPSYPGFDSPSITETNSKSNSVKTISEAKVTTLNMGPKLTCENNTISQPCQKSVAILPNNNIQQKKKSIKKPCKCPVCLRILSSSYTFKKHMQRFHPESPLPTSNKVIMPATSIPVPIMQNLTEKRSNPIGEQKMDINNKGFEHKNAPLNPFPSSSTNLLSDDVDVSQNISLNEQKVSLNKMTSFAADKDLKTSSVSEYVEKTISTIANEIRLESLNKCTRNIVPDQKLREIKSKSINEIPNSNIFPLPSIANQQLQRLGNSQQILLIKCQPVVCFSGRPSETVKIISGLTNTEIKSEPLEILPENKCQPSENTEIKSEPLEVLPDNKCQPAENTVKNHTEIDPELVSKTTVQSSSVDTIDASLLSSAQANVTSTLVKDCQHNSETYSQESKRSSNSSTLGMKTEATANTSISSIKTVCLPSKKNLTKKKFQVSNVPDAIKNPANSKDIVSFCLPKNYVKCQLCQKDFRSLANLSIHMKVTHKPSVLKKAPIAEDNKHADKLSPPNWTQGSLFQSDSASLSSQAKESNVKKKINERSNKIVKVKSELDNENQTEFCEKEDSIAKRRSRRNDECEIIFEKPGTSISSLLSTKCLPKKLNCISRKRYRKCNYSKLVKPKKELSSNLEEHIEIDLSSPVKSSSIPKCVIKVSNDGKYKIDKSPNYLKRGKTRFQFSKRRFHNSIVKVKRGSHLHKRKLFTGLSINKRGRKPLKSINLSSIANSKIKKNRNSNKLAAKHGTKIVKKANKGKITSCKKHSKHLKNCSFAETYKSSQAIKRFLLEHKQPIVVLERLPNKFVNSPPYLIENLPKPLYDFKPKPIVRLKKLNSFSLPNSLSLIKNCYVSIEKLKDSESVLL